MPEAPAADPAPSRPLVREHRRGPLLRLLPAALRSAAAAGRQAPEREPPLEQPRRGRRAARARRDARRRPARGRPRHDGLRGQAPRGAALVGALLLRPAEGGPGGPRFGDPRGGAPVARAEPSAARDNPLLHVQLRRVGRDPRAWRDRRDQPLPAVLRGPGRPLLPARPGGRGARQRLPLPPPQDRDPRDRPPNQAQRLRRLHGGAALHGALAAAHRLQPHLRGEEARRRRPLLLRARRRPAASSSSSASTTRRRSASSSGATGASSITCASTSASTTTPGPTGASSC